MRAGRWARVAQIAGWVPHQRSFEYDAKVGPQAGESLPILVPVRVTFTKPIERRLSTWEAVRGKRARVPGSTMALGRGRIPHDLIQLVVEATMGVDHGFWGCVADGATFKSTGRKRTKPGRRVIAEHRLDIARSEAVVADHVARWSAGRPTPCAEPLADFDGRWCALGDGESLTVVWPSLEVVEPVPFPMLAT
jgi:hypothetical protein